MKLNIQLFADAGVVVIDTKVDTTGIDKGIDAIEAKLNKLRKKAEEPFYRDDVLITGAWNLDEKEQKYYDRLSASLTKLKMQKEAMQLVDIQTASNVQSVVNATEQETENINKWINGVQTLSNGTKIVKKDFEEISQTTNLSNVNKNLEKVGGSINKIISKVGRWALAIFGVRSAYMFIRQEMGVLSQYNKTIGADIEYMRWAIANALKPVIEKIIQSAYKLLVYIGYIIQQLFGVNIFANASAKAFERQKKALSGSNKEAKQLQKTLAGFDEMNIIQDNGDTTRGGGGGGVSLPSQDISKMFEEVEIPEWLKKLTEILQKIKDHWIEIAAIIATIKLASWFVELSKIFKLLEGFSTLQIFGIIAGLALTIYGIYEAISGVIKFIKEPSWENFSKILSGLEKALIGVGIAMIALNASNPIGWIALAAGAVTAIVETFVNWGNETEETTIKLKDTKTATKELADAQKELANSTLKYTNATKNLEKTQKDLEKAEKAAGMTGKELFEQVQVGNITYDKMTKTQRELFDAYIKNLEAQKQVDEATKEYTKSMDEANMKSSKLTGATYQETGAMDSYFKTLLDGFQKGNVSSNEFYKQLNYMLTNMDKDARHAFVDNLPNDIKEGIKKGGANFAVLPVLASEQLYLIQNDTKDTFSKDIPNTIDNSLNSNKYNGIFSKFSSSWNKMIKNLDTTINIKTNLINLLVKMPGMSTASAKKALGLAKGGIVNMPGRGIPYGGATIGEQRPEGVIPLTDSQQMALLGETIGKYIRIDNVIDVNMDSRKIKRIMATSDSRDRMVGNG